MRDVAFSVILPDSPPPRLPKPVPMPRRPSGIGQPGYSLGDSKSSARTCRCSSVSRVSAASSEWSQPMATGICPRFGQVSLDTAPHDWDMLGSPWG